VTPGVTVTPLTGGLPAKLVVSAKKATPFSFRVKSGGQEARASGFLVFAQWDVKWWSWPDEGPKKPPRDWENLVAAKPLVARTCEKLDFVWGTGSPDPAVPADHFATLATSEIDLPAGRYEIRTVSDDGVRVTVDGESVIDDWTWHGPTEDKKEIDLRAGKHAFRVEHFEIDGWAQLQLFLKPIKLKEFR
jgi:hypothetical protein